VSVCPGRRSCNPTSAQEIGRCDELWIVLETNCEVWGGAAGRVSAEAQETRGTAPPTSSTCPGRPDGPGPPGPPIRAQVASSRSLRQRG
jgi:hypothetical protein